MFSARLNNLRYSSVLMGSLQGMQISIENSLRTDLKLTKLVEPVLIPSLSCLISDNANLLKLGVQSAMF